MVSIKLTPSMTVTCLVEFWFHQPVWRAVTMTEICQWAYVLSHYTSIQGKICGVSSCQSEN